MDSFKFENERDDVMKVEHRFKVTRSEWAYIGNFRKGDALTLRFDNGKVVELTVGAQGRGVAAPQPQERLYVR
jgi:hypothetical protein